MSVIEQVIPEGYKQTEVGIIPEDWIVEPLEHFTSFISYGFTNPMPTVYDGPPMITARDINQGRIQYSTARCTSDDAFKKLLTPKSKPKVNDLLLTKDGTLGRLALVDKEDICINQSVALLRPNSKINPSFFKLLLESPYYQEKMLDDAGGSTIKHIYITIVNKMLLGLPPELQEQTAIANALSDVDALLTELEKLIAKKQAIKTATMQQLLTGKTRLPQFATYTEGEKQGQPKGTKPSELGEIPEDWDVVKFGSIVNYIKGYPFKSAEYTDSGIRVVRVSDTSFTSIKNENPIFVSDNSRRKYKKWSLEKDNIIFTTVGSKPPMYDSLVGKAILVESHHEGFLLNQNAVLIKPKLAAENISNLLVSHFRTERYIDHIEQIYRGNANQASITLDGLFEFEIPLPTEPEEQTAIATILSDMDNEIQTLEQRLVKTRQIKQGMMQELLTGRTRLPFEKEK